MVRLSHLIPWAPLLGWWTNEHFGNPPPPGEQDALDEFIAPLVLVEVITILQKISNKSTTKLCRIFVTCHFHATLRWVPRFFLPIATPAERCLPHQRIYCGICLTHLLLKYQVKPRGLTVLMVRVGQVICQNTAQKKNTYEPDIAVWATGCHRFLSLSMFTWSLSSSLALSSPISTWKTAIQSFTSWVS